MLYAVCSVSCTGKMYPVCRLPIMMYDSFQCGSDAKYLRGTRESEVLGGAL
jgi:hypothetical protein